MQASPKFSLSSLSLLLTAVICAFLINMYGWQGTNGKAYMRIIDGDGKGYYMYLPNFFIKKNIREQLPDNRFIIKTPSGSINKYFVGTALAIAPFFAGGYLYAFINDYPVDGYSMPFPKAISFAALFYLLIGLFFLQKFLRLYKVNTFITVLTSLLVVFGTNLLIYVVKEPAMSHVYSFAFVSIFLFASKKLLITRASRFAYLATFGLALVILIRPINGLIFLTLPFLAGSIGQLKEGVQGAVHSRHLVTNILFLGALLSIQPCLWYLQANALLFWSYQHEGFYFSQPHIAKVLFSFRKGFFIYTPLALLSLFGMGVLYKRNKQEFWLLSLFLACLVYIISSWWIWYYGPSFGQRPFIEYYAIFGLLLALFLGQIKHPAVKGGTYLLLLAFTGLNLVQSYQFNHRIMSTWDMTFEKYQYIFLKTSMDYQDCLGGNKDIALYHKRMNKIRQFSKPKEVNGHNLEYLPLIETNQTHDYVKHRVHHAEATLDRFESKPNACANARFVISVSSPEDENYYYYSFKLNNIPSARAKNWKTHAYSFEIPRTRSANDILKLYVNNPDKQPCSIRNFAVDIYGID